MRSRDSVEPRALCHTRPINGENGRDDRSEPAFASPKLPHRELQVRGLKIGPGAAEEDQFGVSALPKQEIAQPLLSSGPDEEVDRGAQLLIEALAADQSRVGGVAHGLRD